MSDRCQTAEPKPFPQLSADGPATGERCRCGAAPHATLPSRCAGGHAWRRNPLTLKHGRYSTQVAHAERPEQSKIRAMLAEREAVIVADLGGPAALSTLQLDLIHEYQRLHAIADWLGENILNAGALTAKGTKRAAVDAYLSVLDRKMRMAAALGLRRVPKDAGLSLQDWLAHPVPGAADVHDNDSTEGSNDHDPQNDH
jgi:hypothetical protein